MNRNAAANRRKHKASFDEAAGVFLESMGEKLALDLRNNIEKVAVQVQTTIPAMTDAIKWIRL
jgi:hypothetical protein